MGGSPDITDTKRIELTSQFINDLNLAVSRSADQDEILHLATKRLGAYLGVRACHVSETDLSAGLSVVPERWQGLLHDIASMVGEYHIDEYDSPALRDAMAAGGPGWRDALYPDSSQGQTSSLPYLRKKSSSRSTKEIFPPEKVSTSGLMSRSL